MNLRTRFLVLQRDRFACRYCGRAAPAVVLHVDHVLPVVLGGSDDPSNLVAACRDCNLGKGAIDASATNILAARICATYQRGTDTIVSAYAHQTETAALDRFFYLAGDPMLRQSPGLPMGEA